MAHTLVSNAQITEGTGNPRTTSLNLASGTTLLVVLINTQSLTDRSGGSPTFNSVALSGGTLIESSEGGMELWYMIDPPTGASYTLSIPNGGGAGVSADISWYAAGSGLTSVLRDSILTNTGTTTNPATASHASCVVGDVLVAGVTSANNSWNPTAVSGTAQLYENDWGTQGSGSQYRIVSSAGANSVNWTFGSTGSWAAISAVFYTTTAIQALKKVVNETLQLVEGKVNRRSMRRLANETLQLVEGKVKARTMRKIVNDSLQLVEAKIKARTMKRINNDTLQLVEDKVRLRGIIRIANEVLQLVETTLRPRNLVRVINETVQHIEVIVRKIVSSQALVRVINETLQLVDSGTTRVRGLLRSVGSWLNLRP